MLKIDCIKWRNTKSTPSDYSKKYDTFSTWLSICFPPPPPSFKMTSLSKSFWLHDMYAISDPFKKISLKERSRSCMLAPVMLVGRPGTLETDAKKRSHVGPNANADGSNRVCKMVLCWRLRNFENVGARWAMISLRYASINPSLFSSRNVEICRKNCKNI